MPAWPLAPPTSHIFEVLERARSCKYSTRNIAPNNHRCGPASPSYDIHDITCGTEPPAPVGDLLPCTLLRFEPMAYVLLPDDVDSAFILSTGDSDFPFGLLIRDLPGSGESSALPLESVSCNSGVISFAGPASSGCVGTSWSPECHSIPFGSVIGEMGERGAVSRLLVPAEFAKELTSDHTIEPRMRDFRSLWLCIWVSASAIDQSVLVYCN